MNAAGEVQADAHNPHPDVVAMTSGAVNETRTKNFAEAVLGALTRICPCVSVGMEKTKNGDRRVYASALASKGDTEEGFCDCIKRHTAGCTMLHDLLVAGAGKWDDLHLSHFPHDNGGYKASNGVQSSVLRWNPNFKGNRNDVASPDEAMVLGHELTHAWTGMWVKEGSKWRWRVPRIEQSVSPKGDMAERVKGFETTAVRI